MKENSLIQTVAQQMLEAGMSLHESAHLLAKTMIIEALRANHGNICRTARELHLHRNTLTRNMADLGIAEVARGYRAELRRVCELRFGGRLPLEKVEVRRTDDRSRVA
jgi:hypothetical protein